MITIKNIKGMSRDQWLAERKCGVGGSDVGKVLGVSEWGTAVDVWLEKTGRTAPVEQSEATWFGNEMEDSVARRYAAESWRATRWSRRAPWLKATMSCQ